LEHVYDPAKVETQRFQSVSAPDALPLLPKEIWPTIDLSSYKSDAEFVDRVKELDRYWDSEFSIQLRRSVMMATVPPSSRAKSPGASGSNFAYGSDTNDASLPMQESADESDNHDESFAPGKTSATDLPTNIPNDRKRGASISSRDPKKRKTSDERNSTSSADPSGDKPPRLQKLKPVPPKSKAQNPSPPSPPSPFKSLSRDNPNQQGEGRFRLGRGGERLD